MTKFIDKVVDTGRTVVDIGSKLPRFVNFWGYKLPKAELYTAKTQCRKIWNKYSRKRNCAASDPISAFVCLSDLYISTISLPILLQENMWTDPGNKEIGNWDWGHAIPFLGTTHKWDFRCSVLGHNGVRLNSTDTSHRRAISLFLQYHIRFKFGNKIQLLIVLNFH